jgi:(S)-2-hydroxy-acid oxidase
VSLFSNTYSDTDSFKYDGQKGVEKTLDILYDEFKRCMMLTGCTEVGNISKASIGIARSDGPLARL